MLSRDSKAYQAIRECTMQLQQGIVVCIDPSIGSSSSMPGYAIYKAGMLLGSGIFELDLNKDRPHRLQQLSHLLRKLYSTWKPDVLVYEEVPAMRHGFGNAVSHASLLNAVGVVLSVSGPDYFVGIMPVSWKKLVGEGYVKSDEEDAKQIGRIVISEAARIQEQEGSSKKKYGKTEKIPSDSGYRSGGSPNEKASRMHKGTAVRNR